MRRIVRKDGKEIHLTKTEFDILSFLTSQANRNRICSREEIIEGIWGTHFKYDTGTVDVHLSALRHKMGWTVNEPIETIRGMGFVFHMQEDIIHFTFDLQALLIEWLRTWEAEIRGRGLCTQLQLTPFINEMTISPDGLKHLLDAALQMLLPCAKSGYLTIKSQLTMDHFILSLDINGMVNELRFPIKK